MKFSPLPITGVGLATAAGRGVEAAWEALCGGRSLLALDPDPELAGFAPTKTARCERIDPGSIGADHRAARLMGHHVHMLLAAAQEAIAGAPVLPEAAGEEFAFFAGMDSVDPAAGDLIGAVRESEEGVRLDHFFSEGIDRIPPLWPLGLLNAIGFSQAAIQHQLRGENAVFSAGAEATARAVCEAAASVSLGKAKFALAAGVSGVVSARMLARAVKRGARSAACGLGEGAGAVLFEAAENADAGRVHGWLKGWGSVRALETRGGLVRAIQDSAEAALSRSGLAPGDVDLLVIHGAGERLAEAAETEAISSVFRGHRPCGLATKGVFGHLGGGSPALDVIIALKALAEGEAPPFDGAAEALSLCAERGLAELRNALVLLQGFDGACAAFALGKSA